MLGVPKAEYRAFKRWSDGITSYQAMIVSEAEAIAGAHDIVEMFHYMSRQLRERRESPREDLLTLIAHASYHGERSLTESEALSMIQQILVAGNETTSNSLSESLLWLAKDQELQGALRRSPEHVPIFVEEMLRLSAPLQGAMRFTIEDVLLGGVAIPAGSAVFISLASANRDECKFEGAELPNVQRRNAGAHLTFGSGSHHCLGAELARLEMRQGLRSWLTRFSTIEIERGAERIEYPRSFALRGPVALKLRMH
jgi:cytochrome P450